MPSSRETSVIIKLVTWERAFFIMLRHKYSMWEKERIKERIKERESVLKARSQDQRAELEKTARPSGNLLQILRQLFEFTQTHTNFETVSGQSCLFWISPIA